MSTRQMRKALHAYMDKADDRLIQLVYNLVLSDQEELDKMAIIEQKDLLTRLLPVQEPNSSIKWKENLDKAISDFYS